MRATERICGLCGGWIPDRVTPSCTPSLRRIDGVPYHAISEPGRSACYWVARRTTRTGEIDHTPSPGDLPRALSPRAHGWVGDEVSDSGDLLELLARGGPAWQKDAACREHPEVSFFLREVSRSAASRMGMTRPSTLQSLQIRYFP